MAVDEAFVIVDEDAVGFAAVKCVCVDEKSAERYFNAKEDLAGKDANWRIVPVEIYVSWE